MSRVFHQRAAIAFYLYDCFDNRPIKNASFTELSGSLAATQKLFNKKDGYYTGINFPDLTYNFAIKADGYMDNYYIVQQLDDRMDEVIGNHNSIFIKIAMTPRVRNALLRNKSSLAIKVVDNNQQAIKQELLKAYIGIKTTNHILRVTKTAELGSNVIKLNNVVKDELVGQKLITNETKDVLEIVDYNKKLEQYILARKLTEEITTGTVVMKCWQIQTDENGLFPLLNCRLHDELVLVTTTADFVVISSKQLIAAEKTFAVIGEE